MIAVADTQEDRLQSRRSRILASYWLCPHGPRGPQLRQGRTAERRVWGLQVGGSKERMNEAEQGNREGATESWKRTQSAERGAEGGRRYLWSSRKQRGPCTLCVPRSNDC